jgi:hypothetical protein
MSDAGLIAKVHFGNSFPSYCQAWWIVVWILPCVPIVVGQAGVREPSKAVPDAGGLGDWWYIKQQQESDQGNCTRQKYKRAEQTSVAPSGRQVRVQGSSGTVISILLFSWFRFCIEISNENCLRTEVT